MKKPPSPTQIKPQFWGNRRRNAPNPNSGGQEKNPDRFLLSGSPELGRGGLLLLLFLLPAIAHAAITVTPADAPTIKKAIAAQKGHVVLVNFWATWCGPCVAEFPAIVQVSRQYKSRGLATIAVSADSLRDKQTKVEPFLAKQGAAFPVYLEQSVDPEDFINAFDTTWQGDLPRTFIYDRAGRRVKTLTGEQTAQSLAAAIQPYLKRR